MKFNQVQLQAIEAIQGPVLIFAGAGTGKTMVMTHRMAHMLQKGIPPSAILAMTFTNKAAREMTERLQNLTGRQGKEILTSTFHSFGARFLRTYAKHIGFTHNFSILDDSDTKTFLKQIIEEYQVQSSYTPDQLSSRFQTFKNHGIHHSCAEKALDKEEIARAFYDQYGEQRNIETLINLYKRYQALLLQSDSMDFSDLILNMLFLLQTHPSVLQELQNRFHYFLIDEFQDTNPAQFQLVQLLCNHTQNLCIVGDDDQAIYSWRGASSQFILKFPEYYPQARIMKLEENYRCSQTILDAANSLIACNKIRYPKSLYSNGEEGNPVQLLACYNPAEEAQNIIEEILKHFSQDKPLSHFAILYRLNYQSRYFEEQLIKHMLPYVLYGAVRFYERAEIKDILSYLTLLINPADDIAFRRAISAPKRKVGEKALEKIKDVAQNLNTSMLRACLQMTRNEIPATDFGRNTKPLKEFCNMYLMWLGKLQSQMNPVSILEDIISDIHYDSYLKQQYPDNYEDRFHNVKELRTALFDFCQDPEAPHSSSEVLAAFMQSVLLMNEPKPSDVQKGNQDAITLMTIHSAKGLEFGHVFVVGATQGVLPFSRACDTLEGLEEERRLMYVALTRGKKDVLVSYYHKPAFGGNFSGGPSLFLEEIPSLKSHPQSMKYYKNDYSDIEETSYQYDY